VSLRRGRLLIVSPSFHGYWRAIEQAFRSLGWDTSTHVYDSYDSVAAKIELKLRSELPRRLGRPDTGAVAERQSLKARAAIHLGRPSHMLVIKGDTLTEPFFDALDRTRAARTLWLYDELRRTRHTEATLDRFDAIASYSHKDTEFLSKTGRTATFVPLAFDPTVAVTLRHGNDVTLIGARYPKRQELLLALHTAGVPVRAYGRDWSRRLFDRARTWRLEVPGFPTSPDLELHEAYAVMAGSPSTLNIHGDQDGFTMRTFEACGVGGVQLVDRADVAEFYEPGREVAAFGSAEELVALARRSIEDDRWGDTLREAARRRTLAEHTVLHRAKSLEATWA